MSTDLRSCRERPQQISLRCSKRKLIVLAPSTEGLGRLTGEIDPQEHAHLLTQLQLLRCKVYVDGGFLKPKELEHGGNWAPVDAQSWHLVSVSSAGQICGCLRLRPHRTDARYSELAVSRSPIARSWKWGWRVRQALNRDLECASRDGFRFVEVGGWALHPNARGSSEALRLALASFAFGELIGGAIGVTTARERGSAPILRKIGGKPIDAVPAYYDPTYRCGLEILRLHSGDPDPRFQDWIDELRGELQRTPVIASHESVSRTQVVGSAAVSSKTVQNATDSSDATTQCDELKLPWRNDDVKSVGWDLESGQFPKTCQDVSLAEGVL